MDGATRNRAGADDRSLLEAATIPACTAYLFEGVNYCGVAGDLVVAIEDVHVPFAAGVPAVHRLPRDQGEMPVDGELRELRLLHAVDPAAEHTAFSHRGKVGFRRLWDDYQVAAAQQLIARLDSGDERSQVLVTESVPLRVSLLEIEVLSDRLGNQREVVRVDGQTPLVLF